MNSSINLGEIHNQNYGSSLEELSGEISGGVVSRIHTEIVTAVSEFIPGVLHLWLLPGSSDIWIPLW